MCQEFQQAIRKNNDQKRIDNIQKQAINQLVDWQITDEKTKGNFIGKAIKNFERVKNIDMDNFEQEKVSLEFQNKNGSPLRGMNPIYSTDTKTILQKNAANRSPVVIPTANRIGESELNNFSKVALSQASAGR